MSVVSLASLAVARPDHPLAHMGPLRLQDLEPYTLLIREPGSGTRLACEEYFKEKRVHFTQTQEVASAEAQRESLLLARAAESPARIAVALGTEYALAIEQKAFRRARRALLEALALERSIGARQMTATTLVYLSDSYLKERKFQEARTYGAQALQAAIDVNSVSDIATARVNLGQAYVGLGQLAEGKRHFDAGLATYEKQGDKPELLLNTLAITDVLADPAAHALHP